MAALGLVLGTEPLTADALLDVVDGAPVRLGAAARARMAVTRSILVAAVDRGEAVYGATRALGAGAGDVVEDPAAFQVRTLRNHAGALGEPLDAEEVRAGMTARLAHLALGGAGARPQVADALAALLDAGVQPLVRDRGSVGMADLALLAPVALVLIGEGSAALPDGRVVPGAEALRAAGLAPLVLEVHEALALLSTNAFTIGVGALTATRAEGVGAIADLVAALSLEAAAAHRPSGDQGPFSEAAHRAYEETGQWRSAAAVRRALAGSFLHDADRPRAVQDELSFRCIPQVHGAFDDQVQALLLQLDDALAVSPENPLVDVETRSVVPNGNFAQPGPVLAVESLRLALAHLGGLAERRISVLSGLARPLRAQGRAGMPGLLAYTAAEDAAALRLAAAPVGLQPTVLSQVEDWASWGWTAVRTTRDALADALELLAIEALHAAALLRDAPERARLGEGTAPLAERVVALLDVDDAEQQVRAVEDVLTAE